MSDLISASNTSSPHSGPLIEPFKEDTPELGADVFIHPSAAVIGRVCLGDRVSIWPQVTLRGDEGEIRIGADTNIQDGTTIHMTGGYSETTIGARVTIGHMCLLHGCKVGDDCLIGMGIVVGTDGNRIQIGAFQHRAIVAISVGDSLSVADIFELCGVDIAYRRDVDTVNLTIADDVALADTESDNSDLDG